jgi:hypothetical protein
MAHRRLRGTKREAFWRSAMTRFVGSGLTVRAFCMREGLSEPSFYAWRRVIRERDALDRSPVAPAAPAFVPVAVRDEPPAVESSAPVERISDASGPWREFTIELRGGRVLRLPAALPVAQVAALIHAIEAVSTDEATSTDAAVSANVG